MSGKRKARSPTVHDAKLARVAQALDSVTRVGDSFASGTCERVSFPAIAFKRADDADTHSVEPLVVPPCKDLKAHGSVAQRQDAREVAWEVSGEQLESRNPRWRGFLDERVKSLRKRLGIAPFATVDIRLNKLVLAKAGARLLVPPRASGTRADNGIFASLLLVLPSEFEGGDVVVHRQPQQTTIVDGETNPTRRKTDTWRSSARESTYDVSYAVFYDVCTFTAEPIRSGAALCLVYDLFTTTPSDIPAFAGPERVQQAVESSLTEDRHFAYILRGGRFDDLDHEELKIADSLAAFCAQSGGEFVLYRADALCSRETETFVTLTAPWIKRGNPHVFTFPPIYLQYQKEVAPVNRVDKFAFRHEALGLSATDMEILDTLHSRGRQIKIYLTKAIVVLPASIELHQLAELPIHEATARLREMARESRNTAVQFAREIMRYRHKWDVVDGLGLTELRQFVAVAMEITDCQLFTDMLRIIDLDRIDEYDSLRNGVQFFGWDACESALTDGMLSRHDWRSRVNLILSTVDESHTSCEGLQSLLAVLLSGDPWVDSKRSQEREYTPGKLGDMQDVDVFCRLLRLVYLSCPERMVDMVSLSNADETIRVVMPAMLALVHAYPNEKLLRAPCVRMYELFKAMAEQLRREVFTGIQIPEHCPKCAELQSFLSSTATDVTMYFVDRAQRDHIMTVISRITWHKSAVRLYAVENTLRLEKEPRNRFRHLVEDTEDLEHQMGQVVASFDSAGQK